MKAGSDWEHARRIGNSASSVDRDPNAARLTPPGQAGPGAESRESRPRPRGRANGPVRAGSCDPGLDHAEHRLRLLRVPGQDADDRRAVRGAPSRCVGMRGLRAPVYPHVYSRRDPVHGGRRVRQGVRIRSVRRGRPAVPEQPCMECGVDRRRMVLVDTAWDSGGIEGQGAGEELGRNRGSAFRRDGGRHTAIAAYQVHSRPFAALGHGGTSRTSPGLHGAGLARSTVVHYHAPGLRAQQSILEGERE